MRICLTPTRNEAWIIRPFLAAARGWANEIIVADQGSTDGTVEHLRATPGVHVVHNDSPTYDEAYRQRLLLRKARQFPGRRILLGLDADEALSANFATSREWQQLAEAPAGTLLRFRWVNVLPGFKRAWIPPEPTVFGIVDDGCEHTGTRIHSPRVPCPPNAPTIDLQEVVVLHFQYVVWERMLSKHRWYQAWEYTQHRQKRALELFRNYHHMHGGWAEREIEPLRPEWLGGFAAAGADFQSLSCEPLTWWDREIVNMLRDHGPEHFRKLAIWNQDWNTVARRAGVPAGDLADPRSLTEKAIHWLLATTQAHRTNWGVRGLEYCLRRTGW